MNEEITLNKLKIGEKALVQNLSTCGNNRRRLRDLGLIDGTPIECVLISPSGDPAAYLIRGAVIALRSEDSSAIKVNK